MNFKTAYSSKDTIVAAVTEIKEQFGDFDVETILFFASIKYKPDEIAKKMQDAFSDALTFGCSTAGEIVSGKALKNSITAMAFNKKVITDIKTVVMEDISSEIRAEQAFDTFEDHFGISMREIDVRQYVGIILIDGLSGVEEKIMDKIGDLSNVIFVGASAGDDLLFKSTYVYSEGKAYANAAVLTLIKTGVPFDFIKTQSFRVKKAKLTATKVNMENREVIEFNNKPAVEAYAEALGVTVDKASKHFMCHPLGLMMGNEPYVRSPQRIKGKSMVFYCNVMEGTQLSLLESTDIVKDTKDAVEKKVLEMGGLSAIINFHCILRALELEENGQSQAYADIFKDIPTIGFNTYGEEYIGHINQTSTMLAFK